MGASSPGRSPCSSRTSPCARSCGETFSRAAYPDRRVPYPSVAGAYAAGVALNAFMPARGGDVAKLVLLRLKMPGAIFPDHRVVPLGRGSSRRRSGLDDRRCAVGNGDATGAAGASGHADRRCGNRGVVARRRGSGRGGGARPDAARQTGPRAASSGTRRARVAAPLRAHRPSVPARCLGVPHRRRPHSRSRPSGSTPRSERPRCSSS